MVTRAENAASGSGTKRVLKWSVPVDDQDHPIGAGRVVHVACQAGVVDVVQVWTEEISSGGVIAPIRSARVYGTGQPIPEHAEHIGTVTPPRTLVWHVYASPQPRRTA